MKKSRKILGMLLAVIMIMSVVSIPASAYYNVTMYAPDGRTIVVDNYDVWAWKSVGWYDYPVVTMYAPDGRSIIVAEADVQTWSSVGWIDGRLTTVIYAADGRTATIPLWQLQSYLNVGWYEYPATYYNWYYPQTYLPKYENVVNGYLIYQNSGYTDSGNAYYTYTYSSTLDDKQAYVDYIKTEGWEYYKSDVLDDYSVWYMTYGNTMVGIYYYFGEDRVSITYLP